MGGDRVRYRLVAPARGLAGSTTNAAMPPDETGDAAEPGPPFPDEVRAQLRAAAESLAEFCGGDVDRAEQVILDSAYELARDATVLNFAPVLASRRARQRLREGQTPHHEPTLADEESPK